MHGKGRFKKVYVKKKWVEKLKEKKKGLMRTYFWMVAQLYTLPSCPEEILNERGDNTKSYGKVWTLRGNV